LEEYEGRFRKLRGEMERENLDALWVHGMPARSRPVRYVANFNFFPGNTLVIMPRDGTLDIPKELETKIAAYCQRFEESCRSL